MSDSQETEVMDTPGYFNPTPTYTTPPQVRNTNKTALLAVLGVVAVAALGAGGYVFLNRNSVQETLPDGGGVYVQNSERNRVDKIPTQETNNAIQSAKDLSTNESLRTLEQNASVIVSPDGDSIPINDLKLVQLDTIKDDVNMKHIEFDKPKVDGKGDMRRITVPGGLAIGKYALMVIQGDLNEGKHKMWAFQVKNSSKSDNKDNEATLTVTIKRTPTPMPVPPRPVVPTPSPMSQPPNTERARTTEGIKIRSSATQSENNQVGSIKAGQLVYIYEYSSNVEEFKGKRSNFARVQPANGGTPGWVFAYFLRKE